jgi:DNA-binding phage protein
MRKYRTWHEVLVEQLADPEEALDYLQLALEGYQKEGDTSFFLRALRTVVEAQGQVVGLSKKTGIAPEVLSKILSSDEPPRIDTLDTILNAFGWRLSIESLEDVSPNLEIPSKERVRLKPTRKKSVDQIAEASPS